VFGWAAAGTHDSNRELGRRPWRLGGEQMNKPKPTLIVAGTRPKEFKLDVDSVDCVQTITGIEVADPTGKIVLTVPKKA